MQLFNCFILYSEKNIVLLSKFYFKYPTPKFLFCRSVTVEKGFVKVFYSVFSTVVMSSVVIFMFCISLVPHTVIERSIQSKLPPQIFRWHQQTDNLQLVNSYGLFRRFV